MKAAQITSKAQALIGIIREKPFQTTPPCEKHQGDLFGAYSRRISIKNRLVYEVLELEQVIKNISMWIHYEY